MNHQHLERVAETKLWSTFKKEKKKKSHDLVKRRRRGASNKPSQSVYESEKDSW